MIEDVPAVARVHAQAHWETYAPLFGANAHALDVAALERRWCQALDDGSLVLVATSGDRGLAAPGLHAPFELATVSFGEALGRQFGQLRLRASGY